MKNNKVLRCSLKNKFALKVFLYAAFLCFITAKNAIAAMPTGWNMPDAPAGSATDFAQLVMNITNWILGFVSMIAVLAIIWGGVNYIGSIGDEDKMKTAKNIITYAIMGLVIAGIAYAVVYVIVNTIIQ